jgi:hypothetical protein
VWVILTEDITDDTSRLAILARCPDSTLIHRIEDTTVYWLESVTDIWEGTRDDD